MESNNLTRLGVHRGPDPLLVGFLLHKAPHLISFRFQAGEHHRAWLGGELDMEILGTGCKAFHPKVEEPRETDAHSPAEPIQGDALAQQLFDPLALRGRKTLVEGICSKLAAARFTLMILLPMASMTIFLAPV